MPNRFFPSPTPGPEPFPPFGLVGWLEQTRVALPLKGVECRFQVCGELLSVEIDQIFHQHATVPMDCLYSFPLPAGAAVYRCEMHVDGRVIRAKVEEEGRAREIVREQKAAGRRTALVELERENLFTLSLGNLQPGDLVVIRFAYFETLTRLVDWVSLRIPFCPGVRYIPGQPLLRALRGKGTADDTDVVPDASRLSPPRIDQLHPDAAYVSVQGVLESQGSSLADLSSPSHPVLVRPGEARTTVVLADRGALPDRDFALRWTERPRAAETAEAWVVREGDEAYALVTLWGPPVDEPSEEDREGRDFYFLVDRSGSMAGVKWEQAVQAFRAFLAQCRQADRAWVTFFNDCWQDFAERPLTPGEWAAEPGLARLSALGTAGGTELWPALQHTVEMAGRHSRERRAVLVLITDGQVGNEGQILEGLRAHPNLPLHAFGIDTAVNDALLVRLAQQQRGSCSLLQPTDDIVGAVARVGTRLRAPALSSLVVEAGWELPEAALPDLHREECLCIPLRQGTGDVGPVILRGRLRDGREKVFQFSLRESAAPAIRLLWAGRKIRRCLVEGDQAQALALAKQHNLICDGAAFVAWDEAEQVPIAELEIYQPVLEEDSLLCRIRSPGDSRGAGKTRTTLFSLRDAGAPPPEPFFGGLGKCELFSADLTSDVLFEQWDTILARHPHPAAYDVLLQFGARLAAWRLRFAGRHFPESLSGSSMAELLMEWVVEGATDASRRMACLEELLERLEREASTPALALAVFRKWVEENLPEKDLLRARLLACG